MLPNTEYIKTLVNGLKEFINSRIKSLRKDIDSIPQADWNQSDPNAKDYVKNRPGGYDVVTPEKIISEYEFPGGTPNNLTIELSEPLIEGRSYRLTLSKNKDYSNPVIDGEAVAEYKPGDGGLRAGIYVTLSGYCDIFQPSTYPKEPAVYQGNPNYAFSYLRLVALANTETIKIPEKYLPIAGPQSAGVVKALGTSQIESPIPVHVEDDGTLVIDSSGLIDVHYVSNLIDYDSDIGHFTNNCVFGASYKCTIATDLKIADHYSSNISVPSGLEAPAVFFFGDGDRGWHRILVFSYNGNIFAGYLWTRYDGPELNLDLVSPKELILPSSTADSTKKFKITVDDSGTLSAVEITE